MNNYLILINKNIAGIYDNLQLSLDFVYGLQNSDLLKN